MQIDTNKFWSKVQVGADNECWPWLGKHKKNGQGVFSVNCVMKPVTRIAWILSGREIGYHTRLFHKCHTPDCCNPNHLSLTEHTVDEHFWSLVDIRGDDECWPWLGQCDKRNDYGRLKIKPNVYVAHRLAWMLSNNQPLSSTSRVFHRCPNGNCCNPNHLTTEFLTLEERFWPYVETREEGECWPWIGWRDDDGYGHASYPHNTGRQGILAHRLSWEIHCGPIPDGLFVCHHCDNPPCVNPKHLFVGTIQDNHRDMVNKGRNRGATKPKGASSPRAVLTDRQATEITNIVGITQKELASIYGVSQSTISRLRRGLTNYCNL